MAKRFFLLEEKFGDVLGPCQLTVLAYKSGDQWVNLSTLIRFGGVAGEEAAFDIRDATGDRMTVFSARESRIDVSNILLRAIEHSEFRHMHINIRLPEFSQPFLQQRTGAVWFYNTDYDPGENTAALLSMSGSMIEKVVIQNPTDWATLEEAIEKLDPPYLGLADLAESYLGYQIGRAYSSTLNALLLIPIKILQAEVDREGRLQVRIRRHPKISREDVSFGLVMKREAGAPARMTFPLSKAAIVNEAEGIETVLLDVGVKEGAEIIVQLRARGEILESTRLYPGITSPRLRSHSMLDPNLEYLQKALIDSRGKPLERAVGMLLHLAGFKVEIFADLENMSSDRFADILAFTPDERTVVIGACVSKNPGPSDITLLAQSSLTTKDTLGSNVTVLPVLFTGVSVSHPNSSAFPSSLQEQAGREAIKLFSRNDLLKALEMVRSGAGPGEVLQLLR